MADYVIVVRVSHVIKSDQQLQKSADWEDVPDLLTGGKTTRETKVITN
jgi:hypothetical protein